ncbi:unnamed protein product (macronuclear) [Paramecium tetraurelia]|uniref:Uncharacterized protein n=1 Tax=Paramecium tetraurelia TaxID=5888 RepID=A0CER3_PARTE|nr:uncharacterized protein GSPATT00037719001 [Paramecium tetraurelia]CAK69280.1 unnamed protein product [Paramecium tetraurelia]|eukprot:XP_001436677.1 hypothetical protein (macronuclear) [Paramecium tetraurelia strain d4-2]
MYYQLAQLSFSGLLLLIQIVFLYFIRRRNQSSSQVFQEVQQVKESEGHTQNGQQMRASIMINTKNRKSVQSGKHNSLKLDGIEELPPMTLGNNQTHQYTEGAAKDQKLQMHKIESPNSSTILQVHAQKVKSQTENPESHRDPFDQLIGDSGPKQRKIDLMIQLTYYIERIGFEQGFLLLLWKFDLNFYIFIPLSLFSGVLLRMQEKLGYRMIQMMVSILIHGLVVLEMYLLTTDEYETICYLIVLGIETKFSVISLILHKKCQ